MTDFQWVFYGYSVADLALAAGRYMMLVAASLLVMKHGAWFARRRYRYERRKRRVLRIAIETVVAAFMAMANANQLLANGATTRYTDLQSVIQVWSFTLLFVSLVMRRGDPPRR